MLKFTASALRHLMIDLKRDCAEAEARLSSLEGTCRAKPSETIKRHRAKRRRVQIVLEQAEPPLGLAYAVIWSPEVARRRVRR